LPLVMIVGIVAAVAIPAYQDYVQRAATEQAQG
jgi:Tfp pilus assembly protein PilE